MYIAANNILIKTKSFELILFLIQEWLTRGGFILALFRYIEQRITGRTIIVKRFWQVTMW